MRGKRGHQAELFQSIPTRVSGVGRPRPSRPRSDQSQAVGRGGVAMSASDNRALVVDIPSAERDLAEAIYAQLISAEHVEYALEVWRDSLLLKTWSDADRMKSVLALTSSSAIDAVLTRRLREAARTGPWDTP